MKKNILFLTFIFLALGSMAQFPLINDAVKQEWSEVSYGVYAPPQGRVCKDIATIFYGEKIFQNGYEYISVMRNISEVQTLLGYMRQDGEKYYFNPKDNEDEFLLYDFSLEKGDTVEIIDETFWSFDRETRESFAADSVFYHFVTEVDCYIDKSGMQRKRITLENGEIWIEGIGCPAGLLHSCGSATGSGNSLLSYSEDNIQLYDAVCPCNFQTAIEDPFYILMISPNPVKDVLQLTLPTANNVMKILDVQGKTVLQTECGEIASINVSLLPAGTYVLMVNNKESQKFVKQ